MIILPAIVPGANYQKSDKPTGAAFQLRPNEPYISVNWLEHFASLGRDEQIEEIRKVLAQKMTSIGATAKLAIYNVREVVQNFPPRPFRQGSA